MALLEAAGYRCTKSGGSLGEWDVIGISATDVVLCQVKSNRGPGPLERLALRDFVIPPIGVRKLIHVWRDRARRPDVQEL
jgi:hypothetical protein